MIGAGRILAAALVLGLGLFPALAPAGSPSAPRPAASPAAARLFLPSLRLGSEPRGLLRFAVIGDYGTCAEGGDLACRASRRVAAMVTAWRPDLVVTVGDNNYPLGRPETWDANLAPYAAFLPGRFEPAIGNHDYLCGSCPADAFIRRSGRDLTRELARPGEDNPLVRFFFLDSNAADDEDPLTVGRKAAAWSPLAAQRAWLAGAARLPACWRLAFMHHPPYSSGGNPGDHPALQPAAGWDYRGWGIDAVLAGHEHSYERLERPDGVAYFVAGTGGGMLDAVPTGPITAGSVTRIYGAYGALLGDADAWGLTLSFYTVDPADEDAAPRLVDVWVARRRCGG